MDKVKKIMNLLEQERKHHEFLANLWLEETLHAPEDSKDREISRRIWRQEDEFELLIEQLQKKIADALQEEPECYGDCDYCPHRYIVPGTEDRIDREPRYYCSLFEEV